MVVRQLGEDIHPLRLSERDQVISCATFETYLLVNMRTLLQSLLVLLASFSFLFGQNPTFTNVAKNGAGNAGSDLAISTSADGGFAWGDINEDGLLDLVVNTHDASVGTRILIARITNSGEHIFEDKTNDYCDHCETLYKERVAILADINHDGYLDLIRNNAYYSGSGVLIYLNRGASEGYQFGVGITNQPHKTIVASDFHDGKMNTEGVFLLDYDGDGWLDIGIENHNFGIDIFKNPKDGSANFTCIDPVAAGLPTIATHGDYSAAADFDDDGDIDIVARKQDAGDFYVNDGDGTFSGGQELGAAINTNKGGVVFADLDNDGDFDLYWTDDDENQIWLNDGSGSLAQTQSGSSDGEPWASAGVAAPATGIDGCAVGDVNNDGKLDLFLTANSGPGYLFINNTPDGGALSFSRNNLGIAVNGNGEGCSFADYDNDGDLDLYVNISGKGNQLWENDLNDDGDNDFLMVEPRIDLGSGVYRAAIGANVVLEDCNGNVISGIREVATASGHGTDAPDVVHFGLPAGAGEYYTVVVKYVTVGGTRKIIRKSVEPAQLAGQKIVINDTDTDDTGLCSSFPVEWLGFEGQWEGNQVNLVWMTASELNADAYDVQRSVDGILFESIGIVDAAGTTQEMSDYQFTDRTPTATSNGYLYYRLRQIDLNGTVNLSTTIEMTTADATETFLKAFPNPASAFLRIEASWPGEMSAKVSVYSSAGQMVMESTMERNDLGQILDVSQLPAGIYTLSLSSGMYQNSQRFVVK